MWRDIAALLPECDSVMVDLPGQGDSGGLWRGFEHAADEVASVIESLAGDRPVHLAALSLGSYVGLTLLAKHPSLCTSALLSGMIGGSMPCKFLRPLFKPFIFLMAPVKHTDFVSRQAAKMHLIKDIDVPEYVSEAGKTTVQTHRQASIDVLNFTLPEGLHLVTTPTVIAAGSEEVAVILKDQPIIAEALQSGGTVVVDGGKHAWPESKPDVFADLLRRQVFPDGLHLKSDS